MAPEYSNTAALTLEPRVPDEDSLMFRRLCDESRVTWNMTGDRPSLALVLTSWVLRWVRMANRVVRMSTPRTQLVSPGR